MKITQKKLGLNTITLSIHVDESDYLEFVESSLSDYRKKANIPGFRPGKVPMGLIKKKYEIPVRVEEINKLLSSNIQKYISENNLSILGGPIPIDNKIDFIKNTNYVFEYELGLQPTINLSLAEKSTLNYWIIKPEKKAIDEKIISLQKRYGNIQSFELIKKGDMLNVVLTELDSENNIKKQGISSTTSILLDKIEDVEIQKKVLKLKKSDTIIIPLHEAFTNKTDLASMLKITKEEIEKIDSNFLCEIKDVSRLIPSELNASFFKKAYPKKDIKTEKELKSEIKNELSILYLKESDRQLFNDACAAFIEKTKIDFPEDFLKKWLKTNIKKEFTDLDFEKEYKSYLKYLSWQLIENQICQKNNIKITNEALEDFAKEHVITQMKNYGAVNIGDKEISGIVKNILENKKESEKMMNELILIELVKYFKSKMKINKKNITLNEFIKLANNQK